MRFVLPGLLLAVLLQGCSLIQNDPEADHESFCKELRYRMTNYTSVITTNQQLSGWQQTAEMDKLEKSYHDHGCD